MLRLLKSSANRLFVQPLLRLQTKISNSTSLVGHSMEHCNWPEDFCKGSAMQRTVLCHSNGGPIWQAVSCPFCQSQFFPKKYHIFLVYFRPDFCSLNCRFGMMFNSCGNLYLNTLTFASLICLCRGSNRLVSWQVLLACLRANSPQTQAHRACQLDPKHSRFRVRTCSDNSGFLV